MSFTKKNIGIVGCGAIGSRIALSTLKELKGLCLVSALYDIDSAKASSLETALSRQQLLKTSLKELIYDCDIMVEAVNARTTVEMIKEAFVAKRHVLAMSTGKLLRHPELLTLAEENHCRLLIPSGAIAGIDALKASSLSTITKITLITRKPVTGFRHSPYLKKRQIDLNSIKKETVIFEGSVQEAVTHFPQNINVAATIALASQAEEKITVRIITSPAYRLNSHEILVEGDFGRIMTRTDNNICPDNPKTSYLAVLSGIQTLKDFCLGVKIGT